MLCISGCEACTTPSHAYCHDLGRLWCCLCCPPGAAMCALRGLSHTACGTPSHQCLAAEAATVVQAACLSQGSGRCAPQRHVIVAGSNAAAAVSGTAAHFAVCSCAHAVAGGAALASAHPMLEL